MKIRLLLTLLGAAALTVSCIKDEPLNAEADIIECTVPGDIVKTDPKIADNTVMILIVPGSTDVTRMAPEPSSNRHRAPSAISPLRSFTKSPRRMGAGTNPTWSA